jgi:hypothetical protein
LKSVRVKMSLGWIMELGPFASQKHQR